jgi:hypothetical protein
MACAGRSDQERAVRAFLAPIPAYEFHSSPPQPAKCRKPDELQQSRTSLRWRAPPITLDLKRFIK